MTITSTNVFDREFTNPRDGRYVLQVEVVGDLPDIEEDSVPEGYLVVVQDDRHLYQAVSGEWVDRGELPGAGGGGGGDPQTSIALDDGTVGAPSLSFGSDADTGIYLAGAGDMRVATAGTVRFRVYSSGTEVQNGASTANDGFRASSNGSAAEPAFRFVGDETSGMYLADTGELALASGGTLVMQFVAGQGISFPEPLLATTFTGTVTIDDDLVVSGDLTVSGTLNATVAETEKVTGVDSAGVSKYYGTDAAGAAGFHSVPGTAGTVTNPLGAELQGAGNLISDAAFQGFMDRYYDLGTDPDTLIASGTATLVSTINAYYDSSLTSALEIDFPDSSGLSNGDAPFGIVSIKLGSGGSVTLGSAETWAWEKASAGDDDPTIPTVENSAFGIRYRYDPATSQYLVNMSHALSASAATGEVEYVATSFQYTTQNNAASPKSATHTFVSTTQDDTVYLIVGFIADGTAAPDSEPAFLTDITAPPTGSLGTQPQGWWYYYKPTQLELTGGTLDLEFEKTNESCNIISFEVTGANSTNPVGGVAFDRSTSVSRTTIGPVDVTTTLDGCLIVAALGCDIGPGDKPDISVDTANSFTTMGNSDSNTDGLPSFLVAYREVAEEGEYQSPVFARTALGEARTQLECFWLVPE